MQKKKPLLIVALLVLLAMVYYLRNTPGAEPASGEDVLNRREQRLIFTKHARCRMDCRHIDDEEVKEILQQGTINYSKSEPNDKPDPKYALEGVTRDQQRVRVVFAPSKKGMVVITVIDLGQEWTCHCN